MPDSALSAFWHELHGRNLGSGKVAVNMRLPAGIALGHSPGMRKVRTKRRAKRPAAGDGAPAGSCPLCDRPMITGPSLDQHHPVPRSHGGRETVTMHKICHRAIHAMLSEQELAEAFCG